MTKEEKLERRRVRRTLMKEAIRQARSIRSLGGYSTPGQVKAKARVLVDWYIKQQTNV